MGLVALCGACRVASVSSGVKNDVFVWAEVCFAVSVL